MLYRDPKTFKITFFRWFEIVDFVFQIIFYLEHESVDLVDYVSFAQISSLTYSIEQQIQKRSSLFYNWTGKLIEEY